jgi:hypothetical protein
MTQGSVTYVVICMTDCVDLYVGGHIPMYCIEKNCHCTDKSPIVLKNGTFWVFVDDLKVQLQACRYSC